MIYLLSREPGETRFDHIGWL